MSAGRRRAILITGIAAALLANYWLLEGALADRTDPAGSWISDLGARSEDGGWRFAALDSLAGLATIAFAVALWPLATSDRRFRHGVIALAASGVCSVLDGVLVNSCAEALTDTCEMAWDAIDIAHAIESGVAVAVTVAAFWLIGGALRERAATAAIGRASLVAGAAWAALTVLAFASYSIPGLEGTDGAFQRAGQVVFGAWLMGLALTMGRYRRTVRR
jgi:hypothetical protein